MTRGTTASPDPALRDANPPATGSAECPGPLDAETRRRIGRNLRLLYAPVLAEPVPERFAALVAALSSPAEREAS
ncbi:MAG TPA: NepR family anti-sigma factor [Methylobacterium sp.]|jgi:hypothetical protein